MFLFEEDRLVCERVYFDAGTVLRQLGIAHDPLTLRGRVATVLNHPLTVGQARGRRAAATGDRAPRPRRSPRSRWRRALSLGGTGPARRLRLRDRDRGRGQRRRAGW